MFGQRDGIGATAGDALDAVVESWSMASPRLRVRLGATMAASVIFARGRMPAIPAVLAAVGVGVLAERAYVVVHDVHQAAIEIRNQVAADLDGRLIDESPFVAFKTGSLPRDLCRSGGTRPARRNKGRDKAENGKRFSVV